MPDNYFVKQIVVIAGGKGTRLYPLTKSVPKSLVLINKTPFIMHQIQLFKKNNISEVVLCLGIFQEKIRDFLDNQKKIDLNIKYSFENSTKLLGTLGALKNASSLLDKEFFLIYGDSYLDTDYQKIYQTFSKSNKLGLMTVYKNKGKLIPSNVSIKDGMVVDYDKSNSKKFEYIDYGLSIFKKTALDYFPNDTTLDLHELIKKLISLNQLTSYQVAERFYEIGSFEGIKDLEFYLRD